MKLRPEPLRIGVFGGAFDPPHNGHVMLAHAAISQLDLCKLHVVPTGIAWHKARELTPPVHRLAMTRLAFANMPRVLIDRREIERTGPTFTIDTLEGLTHDYPTAQLYLIMGADQLAAFQHWHRWQSILDLAIICVAERANSTRASGLLESFLEKNAQQGHPDRVVGIHMTATSISATRVRQTVLEAATGCSDPLDLSRLVCPAVARYISDHALYQAVLPG
ncbi:MAG: nicotinate (nicotinamide) nucleotide adenylyltransferase [Polaromonas sp.]|nr:nicotinate (nicotinamide) nucleotide adenylyltransferase [Polaromonas sp.]